MIRYTIFMDIVTYAGASILILVVWYFAMNAKQDSAGLLAMIGLFIFGGFIGWYMQSLEVGLMFSVLLSLVFIG